MKKESSYNRIKREHKEMKKIFKWLIFDNGACALAKEIIVERLEKMGVEKRDIYHAV